MTSEKLETGNELQNKISGITYSLMNLQKSRIEKLNLTSGGVVRMVDDEMEKDVYDYVKLLLELRLKGFKTKFENL